MVATNHRLTVTPAEAAEMLGLNKRTVEKMVSRGDLTASRIGRKTLIAVDDIRAMLERNRVKGVA